MLDRQPYTGKNFRGAILVTIVVFDENEQVALGRLMQHAEQAEVMRDQAHREQRIDLGSQRPAQRGRVPIAAVEISIEEPAHHLADRTEVAGCEVDPALLWELSSSVPRCFSC